MTKMTDNEIVTELRRAHRLQQRQSPLPSNPIFEQAAERIEELISDRRERMATRFVAELVGPITFPQSVEDQLHAVGVKTEDFEAYAAHIGTGFADALIAELDK